MVVDEVSGVALREFVLYRGENFWLQTSGRYFQSGRKGSSERLLHRRVWIDNFGSIPEGFEVHHKDDDWRNSDPDNLELMAGADHRRLHALQRNATQAGYASSLRGLAAGRDKAAEWHRSEQGRAWHSQTAINNVWRPDRAMLPRTCIRCNSQFEAFFARAMYCSNSCIQKAAYARRGRADRKRKRVDV